MKDSARYAKVVAWSEEDQCYIGYLPGLVFGGCCHGDDEQAVFSELCEIADECIEIHREDHSPLPDSTAGYHFQGHTLKNALMAIEPETAPV